MEERERERVHRVHPDDGMTEMFILCLQSFGHHDQKLYFRSVLRERLEIYTIVSSSHCPIRPPHDYITFCLWTHG
jgi:hypothetical protein